MSVITKDRVDDGIIVDIGEDGEPNVRCDWRDSVCLESPGFVIAPRGWKEDPSLQELYCERHYVLSLARLKDIHMHDCNGPLSAHAERYGPL